MLEHFALPVNEKLSLSFVVPVSAQYASKVGIFLRKQRAWSRCVSDASRVDCDATLIAWHIPRQMPAARGATQLVAAIYQERGAKYTASTL